MTIRHVNAVEKRRNFDQRKGISVKRFRGRGKFETIGLRETVLALIASSGVGVLDGP